MFALFMSLQLLLFLVVVVVVSLLLAVLLAVAPLLQKPTWASPSSADTRRTLLPTLRVCGTEAVGLRVRKTGAWVLRSTLTVNTALPLRAGDPKSVACTVT